MARPKKEVTPQPVEEDVVANALTNASGMFDSVVVVGIKPDGNVDVVTSHPNFPHMQSMLQDALFELFLYKKQQLNSKKET